MFPSRHPQINIYGDRLIAWLFSTPKKGNKEKQTANRTILRVDLIIMRFGFLDANSVDAFSVEAFECWGIAWSDKRAD